MMADGFLNQRQRHPVAMTAAITINLAAVAAVLLVKSGTVQIPEPPIRIIDVAPESIPDEVKPKPQPERKRAQPEVYTPKPKVSEGSSEPDTGASGTSEWPPLGSDGIENAKQVEPAPTPTPLPVLTEAVPLPSAAREFQPPYPPQLLRTGVEGKAVVRVLIGTDGRVKQVAVISADDPLFAEATERQAMRRWRFKPATRDGVPVETWKQLTVRFEIR